MAEGREVSNSMSGGAVQGSVVQIGVVHGDVNAAPRSDEIKSLSASVIVARLARTEPHPAAISLANIDPGKAADVIRMMLEARRVEIITSMDPTAAAAILDRLPDETTAPLYLALHAARSISTDAAAWHHLVGAPSGDFGVRGRSERGTRGYASHYERGTVYWSERTGTGMVAGAIKKHYWKLGGLSGRLGYPIGYEKPAATSIFKTSGTFQRFESTGDYGDAAIEKIGTMCGATIYSSREGVFATWGGIGDYYEAGGGTWGPLGFPVSDEIPLAEGCRQEFEGGPVFWSEQGGVIGVTGKVYDLWCDHQRELGLPTTPEQTIKDGPDLVQFFDKGVIAIRGDTATHWLSPTDTSRSFGLEGRGGAGAGGPGRGE